MPILYHSNGMPHNIPDSEIKFALLRGLRFQPPVITQQQLQPVITAATSIKRTETETLKESIEQLQKQIEQKEKKLNQISVQKQLDNLSVEKEPDKLSVQERLDNLSVEKEPEQPPSEKEPEQPPSEKEPEQSSSEQPTSETIKVNAASLKEIISLPNMPTAVGRKLIQNRPYGSIEDLIAKLPEFDWSAIAPRLDFNVT